jgi:hypothetical protein
MVRAILDGRKTQTRRVMKPVPTFNAGGAILDADGGQEDYVEPHWVLPSACSCPYGKPGDLLWVREGFAVQPELWADNHGPQPIHYTADQVIGFAGKPDQRQIEDYRSKPSIHMPRWASRITLRITDIRVERLQDITEDDARAEGCDPARWIDETDVGMEGYREGFARLWNKINGPGAWDANPWIWAVSFERVKP